MQFEGKSPRAMEFYQSSLPGVLRDAATWLQDQAVDSVGDVVVSEDPDGDWWVVVYWYPAIPISTP